MRVRTLTAGLLIGGLTLGMIACGKSGSPAGEGGNTNATIAPPPAMQVATNVEATGSPTFTKMKQRGHVVIGVKDDQPGLSLKDPTTGKYAGFDIDIAHAISAQLGFDPATIEYKPVPSASREQALINGQVDYYVGTYTINDQRKMQVGFAGPYYVAGQGLLVRKDDDSIKDKSTLKGKKVCSVQGSTPLQNVQKQQLTEPSNIVAYQKYTDCVTALENKQVDVLTTDDAILAGYAAQEPNKLKLVGQPFTQEPYGVGLQRDDKALRDKIDDILQKIMDDGDWQKFYDSTLGVSGTKAPPKPVIQRY